MTGSVSNILRKVRASGGRNAIDSQCDTADGKHGERGETRTPSMSPLKSQINPQHVVIIIYDNI